MYKVIALILQAVTIVPAASLYVTSFILYSALHPSSLKLSFCLCYFEGDHSNEYRTLESPGQTLMNLDSSYARCISVSFVAPRVAG